MFTSDDKDKSMGRDSGWSGEASTIILSPRMGERATGASGECPN